MKQQLKLILLSGAMIIGAQTAQAQTCATQPSCSELGYTLTSTTDCIGTVLKCPFDKSKYYCTTKTETLNKLKADYFKAMVPDYTKGKSLPMATNYTITENGWVSFMGSTNETQQGKPQFRINYVDIGSALNTTDENTIIVPVFKGDVVWHSGKGEWSTLKFYPCRGN